MTTTTTTKKKTRNQRTPAQIVADLEAKIADVKARAAAKQAKQNPEAKSFMIAVKAIDKALDAATDEETSRALEAARAPLSTRMVEMGLRVADRKGRRGRRPRVGLHRRDRAPDSS